MFESVNAQTDARTHRRTDAQTPARLVYYKLTLSAFGSGELKSLFSVHLSRSINLFKTNCRPVYFGSCACVVKIAVKCSFEYLSVVHHTRRHQAWGNRNL